MKKIFVLGLLVVLIAGLALLFAGNGNGNEERGAAENAYLRVHIRANSNSDADQAVKYKVRDRVVAFLTPTVAECRTKEQAMQKIGEKLTEAAQVADAVLRENGYAYGARASLREEEFPTRVYEDLTLAAGVYDALIIELGAGAGDNWWCVVYPPLCFAGGTQNIVYKSKIAEIIRGFYKNR